MEPIAWVIAFAALVVGYIIGVLDGSRITKRIYEKALREMHSLMKF